MPEPLPSPYVDTGQSLTVTRGGSVKLHRCQVGVFSITPCAAAIGSWEITNTTSLIEGGPSFITANGPNGASETLEEITEFSEAGSETYLFQSGTISVSETLGPFRLGVKCELTGASASPNFAKDYQLVYKWFRDENTELDTTITGALGSFNEIETYVAPGDPPEEVAESELRLGWAGATDFTTDAPDDLCTFTSLSVGSTVDTSGLTDTDGPLTMTGGGGGGAVVEVTTTTAGSYRVEANAGPPYTLTYDLDILDAAGGSTGAQVTLVNPTSAPLTVTTPYSATTTYRNVSWVSSTFAGYETLSIPAAYAAARDPAWDSADLAVRIHAMPALASPSTQTTYSPVTVTLASELDVHRPDGATPSNFVTSDAAKLTVTEGATTTTFNVSATGAYARRQFGAQGTNLPIWRRWLGVGASGKADGLFSPDLTHKTKHAASGDIFDWSSYAYLKAVINAPSAGNLTLTVEGVQVEVYDNHETGASRNTAFTVTETPYTADYTVPLVAGANTVLIDLHFPASGSVPFYHGRIDALKLSGFATGTYTLSELKLVSCTDPNTVGADEAYLKLAFRGVGQRSGDYDCLHAAHNGAACMAALTDQTQCSELFGEDGHGLRYVTVITGSGTGIITDAQINVDALMTLLHEVEGWTATYSAAAYEAANEDSFGTSLTPQLSEWLNDWLPHKTLTAGSASTLPAQPKCGRLYPAPGLTFLIRTRDVKGSSALEVLAKTEEGTRGPEGADVEAVRDDTLAVVATAETDAHGYATLAPIPANGSLQISVA